MLSQPQRLRRFAVYVLLVWLFGLGSGIVNACVVHTELSHGSATVAPEHDGEGPVTHPADMQQAGDDHDECDQTRPPCERLCDAPSVVPQAEKQQSNPLSGFWLVSAPIPASNFQRSAEPNRAVSSTVRWHTTIPISIAYLRLTL
jgi:hypothetical protein